MLSDTAAFSLNISQQIHCIVATHKSTGSHLGQVNLFDVFLLPPTMLSDLHTIHTHFHTRTHTHIIDTDVARNAFVAINTAVPTHMRAHASNTSANGFTSCLDDVDDS